MKKEFVVGTQYLRGLSPDPAHWERDCRLMRELRFNTIRVWLVWGVLEPARGAIDFAYIDRILSLAEAHGLKVIFLFHLHACPEWAVSAYRHYWYVDRRGTPFEPAVRGNTPSGGWPGLCPDFAEVRELEAKFISAVCRHVGDRAFAYEPINEPHLWIDLAEKPVREYCYCTASRQAFRSHLERKYGTLDELGRAWGRRFDAWESVRPPTWNFGYSDAVDWREFCMESVASLVRRRSGVIRANTGVPVVAHAWGGGCVNCINLGAMAFDDWRNAEAVSLWGCSVFPWRNEDTANLGLSMDAARSAAEGKDFWQAELGAGDLGTGFRRMPETPADIFSIWCWESVGHGARGLLFWQFSKELYGNESGNDGLLDLSGALTDRARAAGKIAGVLRDNEDLFLNAAPPQPEVALLFNVRSYLLDWAVNRNNQLSCDAMAGYYRAFWDANIPVDILHPRQCAAEVLSRYKFLVLPMSHTLPPELTPLLEGYVEAGGQLLADPMLSAWDGNLRLSPHLPGNGLHTLFGAESVAVRNETRAAVPIQCDSGEFAPVGGFYVQRWKTTADTATVHATYRDGSAAIVRNRRGAGTAYLCGVNLGNMNSLQSSVGDDLRPARRAPSSPDAARLILDLAGRAGVGPALRTPPAVRAKRLFCGKAEVWILFEFTGAEHAFSVECPKEGFTRFRSLLDGRTGLLSDGRLPLRLKPWETEVLVVE